MEAWVFWSIIGFQTFVGIVLLIFTGWFMWMRGSGQWGGGKRVLDFSVYPHGKVKEWRAIKRGPLHVHPSGGNDGVMLRQMGVMKIEEVPVNMSDVINPPHTDLIFYGRKGIEKAFELYLNDKQQVITDLRNGISQVKGELSKKNHDIEAVQDRITKMLNETAKAMYGFQRQATKKKG